MTINCPHCHQEIAVEEDAAGRYACPLCAGSLLFERAAPVVPPPPPPSLPLQNKAVLCEKCQGPMVPDKTIRFGAAVANAGALLLSFPGALSLAFGLIIFFYSCQPDSRELREALIRNEPEKERIYLKRAFEIQDRNENNMILGMIVGGIVGLSLGEICRSKIKVRKCTVCGFHFPTA